MKTSDVLDRLEELFVQEVRKNNNYGYKQVLSIFDEAMKKATREYITSIENKNYERNSTIKDNITNGDFPM